jgi:hypothetical protein
VSQRSIEVLIGRLITDEAFRDTFVVNRSAALQQFQDTGYELTRVEVEAILTVPPRWWRHVAADLDPRLQRANLASQETGEES